MSNKGPGSQDEVDAALSVNNAQHVGEAAPDFEDSKKRDPGVTIGNKIENFASSLKGQAKDAAKETADILKDPDSTPAQRTEALQDFVMGYESLGNMMDVASDVYSRDELKDASTLAKALVVTLESTGHKVSPEQALQQSQALDDATKQLVQGIRQGGTNVIEKTKSEGKSAGLGAAVEGVISTMGKFSEKIGDVTGPILGTFVKPLAEAAFEKAAPMVGQVVGNVAGTVAGSLVDAVTKGSGSGTEFGKAGGEMGKGAGQVIGDLFKPLVGELAGELTQSVTKMTHDGVGSVLESASTVAGSTTQKWSEKVGETASSAMSEFKGKLPAQEETSANKLK